MLIFISMKTDGYIKASLRERILLSEFLKLKKDFTILHTTKVDSDKKYDAVIMSGGTEYIVEIKVRLNIEPLKSYLGYVIQKDKYDYLMSQYKEKGLTPLYINFFRDGIVIWNLLNIDEPKWNTNLFQQNNIDTERALVEKITADVQLIDADIIFNNNLITEATERAFELYKKYF